MTEYKADNKETAEVMGEKLLLPIGIYTFFTTLDEGMIGFILQGQLEISQESPYFCDGKATIELSELVQRKIFIIKDNTGDSIWESRDKEFQDCVRQAKSIINIVEEKEFICKGILYYEGSKIQQKAIEQKLANEEMLEIYIKREVIRDRIVEGILREVAPGQSGSDSIWGYFRGKKARINTSYIKEISVNDDNSLLIRTANSKYCFTVLEMTREDLVSKTEHFKTQIYDSMTGN